MPKRYADYVVVAVFWFPLAGAEQHTINTMTHEFVSSNDGTLKPKKLNFTVTLQCPVKKPSFGFESEMQDRPVIVKTIDGKPSGYVTQAFKHLLSQREDRGKIVREFKIFISVR